MSISLTYLARFFFRTETEIHERFMSGHDRFDRIYAHSLKAHIYLKKKKQGFG